MYSPIDDYNEAWIVTQNTWVALYVPEFSWFPCFTSIVGLYILGL